MSRYNYYELLEKDNENEILIYDLFSVNWSEFDFPSGYADYYLNQNEILKPYLISFNNFGTTVFEDIIMLINGIEDPTDELYVGMEIKMPYRNDLIDFQRRFI